MSVEKLGTDKATDESCNLGKLHLWTAFGIVLGGMLLIALVFGVAMGKFTEAADVAAVVGAISTAIGTLTGAFFAMQVGESSKQQILNQMVGVMNRLEARNAELILRFTKSVN